MLFYKGNGRNVHVQTKGVYVWYVIYFTSLLYHKIIGTSTIHKECNMNVTKPILLSVLHIHSNRFYDNENSLIHHDTWRIRLFT
ncbi:hypothetical protein H4683_004292 [Filibacter limicola]|uniref:Uncharacterized protein n=1 Tax=Sporosarcina limicola TaxID=34101 RepID=A0A927MMP8_9BACL|nr:hypothetical protein [Sporosarcina limicola]